MSAYAADHTFNDATRVCVRCQMTAEQAHDWPVGALGELPDCIAWKDHTVGLDGLLNAYLSGREAAAEDAP